MDIRDVEAAKRLEVVAKQREAEARERNKQEKIEKRKAKKEKEKEKEREGDRMVIDLTDDEEGGMIDLTLDEKGGEDAEQRVCPSSSFWPSWLRL